MKKLLPFFVIVLLIVSQASGQFILKGDFRPRVEFRDGYGQILSKNQDPIFTVSERARLTANYTNGIFSFGIGIQDVRVWGDDYTTAYTGTPTGNATLQLNEGWIGIKPYKDGFFKIGRQYWAYEDERMLSIRGWNQSEIKYDAFLFQHMSKDIQVDVGLSWNNAKESNYNIAYDSLAMKTLNFLYVKKNINDHMYVSLLALASGFTASSSQVAPIYLQGTYGLYFSYKKDNINALANGYYQNGRNRTGKVTNAYLLSGRFDYIFAKKFTLGAGIDYISGTNQDNDDADYASKNHTFDNLYGIRHRILGHLDYFNNMPKATGNGGMGDYFLKFNHQFVSNALWGIDIHYMALQNNVVDKTSETGAMLTKGLGEEIDLYISWDIVKWVQVRGGYSTFFATSSMEKLQNVYDNARMPNWVWVMITAKPVFFDNSSK
jgi:hypothetical protein